MFTIVGSSLILFTLLYGALLTLCIYQEEELSLPHEKAIRMNVFIVGFSALLFFACLYFFFQIEWHNITLPVGVL